MLGISPDSVIQGCQINNKGFSFFFFNKVFIKSCYLLVKDSQGIPIIYLFSKYLLRLYYVLTSLLFFDA